MKRIHLFEFEDQTWFPGWLRERMTRYIVAIHKVLGSADQLADLIARGLKHSPEAPNQVIDLCSGSGGPMAEVAQILRKKYGLKDIQISLSDLYPNQAVAANIAKLADPSLKYLSNPVDAGNVSSNQKGMRTMVCSLHHMKPEIARNILKDALEDNQPICVFEISDNSFPKWIWWMAIPFNFLTTFFVTLMVRPMTWQQVVFTYLFPILPAFIAWDGAVSNARTYTLEDLDILLQGLESDNYTWEKGILEGKGKKMYLLGLPKTKV